jgi:hypothetical protein
MVLAQAEARVKMAVAVAVAELLGMLELNEAAAAAKVSSHRLAAESL